MTVWLAIRVYVDGTLESEKQLSATPAELEELLSKLADEHARLAAERPTMIEIEFLDEPDVNQRFFRMGTDPRYMVLPVALDMSKEN